MILIILSLFLAFILVTRSIESVVTDEVTLKKIDNFHIQVRIYVEKFTATTFRTASSGIIINSLRVIILFFAVIYMVSILMLGIALNAGNTNTSFILQEIYSMAGAVFILLFLSNGFKTDFSTFYKNIKTNILQKIKNPLVLFLIVLYYFLILGFYYISFTFLKNFNIPENVIFEKIIENQTYLILLLLPILIIITFIIIEFVLWSLCRFTAFLSYRILKYLFVKSQKLNPEKPLKPLLLIVQTISLIAPPIIAFTKELLS